MTRTTSTPDAADSSLDPTTVLNVLNGTAARRILSEADEPRTAAEFSERCEVPLSTVYRQLDRLTDADLLRESICIRDDGHHVSRYERTFDSLELVPDDGGLTIRHGPDHSESGGVSRHDGRVLGVSD